MKGDARMTIDWLLSVGFIPAPDRAGWFRGRTEVMLSEVVEHDLPYLRHLVDVRDDKHEG